MKRIKTFEKMIGTRKQQFDLGADNIYRFKIGDFVKIKNKPKNIYKVITINLDNKNTPYLVSAYVRSQDDKKNNWCSGTDLDFASREEKLKYNL